MPSFSAQAALAKGLSPEMPKTWQLRSEYGEGHGDKKEKDVLLTGLLGEFYDFGTSVTKGDEGKIRGLIANFDAHIAATIGASVRMETGIFSFVRVEGVGFVFT